MIHFTHLARSATPDHPAIVPKQDHETIRNILIKAARGLEEKIFTQGVKRKNFHCFCCVAI